MQLMVFMVFVVFLVLLKPVTSTHWTVGVHSSEAMPARITYTRCELLSLANNQLLTKTCLNTQAWTALCQLGLSVRGPTPRGCRGGTHKQRQITTVTGNRPARQTLPESTAGRRNLREITLKDTDSDPHTNNASTVKFALVNCRSVRNKTEDIVDYITEHQLDLMALTETWLSTGERDKHIIHELTPAGYTLLHRPRGGRGGGTAILFKSGFSATLESLPADCVFNSFEHMSIRLTLNNAHIATVIVVYRSSSLRNTAEYFKDFTTLCEHHAVSRNLLIAGDFNFHMDIPTNIDTRRMTSLLDSMDLHQHVTFPTHQEGHTLDLLISRITDNVILPGTESPSDFIS